MGPKKLKILHTVEFYSPSVGGMQEVVQRLSEGLVKSGHEVWVATTKIPGRTLNINGVQLIEFDISGNEVNGYRPGDNQRYQDFLLESRFDIVTNFAAQQWATDLALPLLEKIQGKKIFVPTGFSGLYNPAYREYFLNMRDRLFKYDSAIFLSDDYRDVNLAKEVGYTKRKLIPNGASREEFSAPPKVDIRKKYNIPENDFLVLTVGSHTGEKGHRECFEIFDRANIPHSTLFLVANSSSNPCTNLCRNLTKFFPFFGYVELNFGKKGFIKSLIKKAINFQLFRNLLLRKKVINKTVSREDAVLLFKAADVFFFPSNIECSPIVLFESMAAGVPFLSTDVGNVLEIIKWTGGGEVLPTRIHDGRSYAETEGSALMLRSLAQNDKKREALAQAGHKAWSDKFTWEKIISEYEAHYIELATGPDR